MDDDQSVCQVLGYRVDIKSIANPQLRKVITERIKESERRFGARTVGWSDRHEDHSEYVCSGGYYDAHVDAYHRC